MLTLDSTKAMRELGWHPKLTLADAVSWSAEWYRRVAGGADAADVSGEQIDHYVARTSGVEGSRAAA